MGKIRPIQTKYAGHLFRSRLEARWAVYLEYLGREWVYEKEGYSLPSGCYLPDFWLPVKNTKWRDSGYWLEVKPLPPTERERAVAEELAALTKHHLILVAGPPTINKYVVYKTVVDSSDREKRVLEENITLLDRMDRDSFHGLVYTFHGSDVERSIMACPPMVELALESATAQDF